MPSAACSVVTQSKGSASFAYGQTLEFTSASSMPPYRFPGTRLDYYKTSQDCFTSPITGISFSQNHLSGICGPTLAQPNGGTFVVGYDKLASCLSGVYSYTRHSTSSCASNLLLANDVGATLTVPTCYNLGGGTGDPARQYIRAGCDSGGQPTVPPTPAPTFNYGAMYVLTIIPINCETPTGTASAVEIDLVDACIPQWGSEGSVFYYKFTLTGTPPTAWTLNYYSDPSCNTLLTGNTDITTNSYTGGFFDTNCVTVGSGYVGLRQLLTSAPAVKTLTATYFPGVSSAVSIVNYGKDQEAGCTTYSSNYIMAQITDETASMAGTNTCPLVSASGDRPAFREKYSCPSSGPGYTVAYKNPLDSTCNGATVPVDGSTQRTEGMCFNGPGDTLQAKLWSSCTYV